MKISTLMNLPGTRGILFATSALTTQLAGAAVAYDEGSSGDLSGSGLAPTSVTLGLGSNEVLGTSGRGASVDRDYLTFQVPVGQQLSSLKVLAGTTVGGNAGFIGIQSGPQLTLPTNPADATGLLGWRHYAVADIGSDILDELGVATFGSTGFSGPLGAGTYSVWIQDTSAGSYTYGFDFGLERAPLVPEARNGVLLVGALGAMVVARRRMASKARPAAAS